MASALPAGLRTTTLYAPSESFDDTNDHTPATTGTKSFSYTGVPPVSTVATTLPMLVAVPVMVGVNEVEKRDDLSIDREIGSELAVVVAVVVETLRDCSAAICACTLATCESKDCSFAWRLESVLADAAAGKARRARRASDANTFAITIAYYRLLAAFLERSDKSLDSGKNARCVARAIAVVQ